MIYVYIIYAWSCWRNSRDNMVLTTSWNIGHNNLVMTSWNLNYTERNGHLRLLFVLLKFGSGQQPTKTAAWPPTASNRHSGYPRQRSWAAFAGIPTRRMRLRDILLEIDWRLLVDTRIRCFTQPFKDIVGPFLSIHCFFDIRYETGQQCRDFFLTQRSAGILKGFMMT